MKKVDMWPTVNRVSKYGYTGMLRKRLDEVPFDLDTKELKIFWEV